jgi:hypothetical protein
MEFLAIIAALSASMSKALEIAWFHIARRRKALAEVKQQQKQLVQAIGVEGTRIQKYLEFDNLIGEIEGALTVVLENNKRLKHNSVFWEIIEPTHQQLYRAVSITLHNFNISSFRDYHRGQVDGGRPNLEQLVYQSEAFFAERKRQKYIDCIRLARPHTGQMKGFANMIIRDVSTQLVNFGH